MICERITDASDERVSAYRDLLHADRLRARGLVACEGRLVVAQLLRSRLYEPASVLLSEHALASLRDVLQDHPITAPIYLAPRDVLASVVGFDMHRGCIAMGRERHPVGLPQLLGATHGEPDRPALLAVLEDLANHDNTGTVLRSLAAFGGRGVLISTRCCDPLYRKSVRVSMGCALHLPIARASDWPADLQRLKHAGCVVVALDGRAKGGRSRVELGELPAALADRPAPRIALMIGAEGPGLTEPALAHADLTCTIPQEPGVDSLNAGVAASIALQRLYEWAR